MEVRGFKTAALAAGIKANGALDLALICSDTPATAAAVFTQNFFIAPPLIVSRRHLEETNHRVRALIVNSGNANAATGEAGIRAARECAEAVASNIGCKTSEVLVYSTVVIGSHFQTRVIMIAVLTNELGLGIG